MGARDFTADETIILDAYGFPSGLVGTIGVRIVNLATGSTVIARATAGIVEPVSGSGIYLATLASNPGDGRYADIWDSGTVSPSTVGEDSFKIGAGAVVNAPTLTNVPWPVGTVVKAYTTAGDQAGGPGVGTPLATATVASNGTLTFTGLTANRPYIAAATVNGSWVKVRFAA